MDTGADMSIADLRLEAISYRMLNKAQADHIAYMEHRNAQLCARTGRAFDALAVIEGAGCTSPYPPKGQTCASYSQAACEHCWPCVAKFKLDESRNIVIPKQEKAPDSES